MDTKSCSVIISQDNISETNFPVESSEEPVDIWKNCISNEFPVLSMEFEKNKVVCQIGSPHSGYSMITSQKKGKFDGKAKIYDPDGKIVAMFTYKQGIANGKCQLYYPCGKIFFNGFLNNGYRNGEGVEYSKNGEICYSGFFKNGCKAPNITRKGYSPDVWEERNESHQLISIFPTNEIGQIHGICYSYSNGNIKQISRWEDGEEVEIQTIFKGKIMTVYENEEIVYEGRYEYMYGKYIPQKTKEKIDRANSILQRIIKWTEVLLWIILGIGILIPLVGLIGLFFQDFKLLEIFFLYGLPLLYSIALLLLVVLAIEKIVDRCGCIKCCMLE